MGKNKKKGPKANVFKVAGAKSLKKSKAKAVTLGLKNATLRRTTVLKSKYKRQLGNPIKYQRKPGSRRYINYTPTQLQDCLTAVRAKKVTQRDAADHFDIPRSTIKNKLANKSTGKPGRQPIFTVEEEALFVSRLSTLSDFGFPLTNYDIKMVIKEYLTTQNKSIPSFRNNIPGKDWIKFFFDRHKTLCEHLESKYEAIKSQVSENVIRDFIERLSEETENVPPENIYSYDELNLRDDPGRKVAIGRRGIKYPETSVNATKPKFSVMFCGNAVGETIPPYIIYKTEPHCSTWTANGPKGARYNCTSFGWMDIVTFENWFLIHLLPILKKKKGPKILIGDSYSSHISGKVLAYCEKYNIRFLCLPHKTANILQPLHFAYFEPLRRIWSQLLLDWISSQIAKKKSTTLTADFPYLLKKALIVLTDIKENMIAGFEITGIFPVDVEKSLARLPRHNYTVNTSIIDMCDSDLEEAGPSGCQKVEFKSEPDSETDSDSDTTNNQLECIITTVDSSESNVDLCNDVYLVIVQDDDVVQIPIQFDVIGNDPLSVTVGDHVIVNRGSTNYPGKVLAICEEGAYVHCMKKWLSLWRWPSVMKEQLYSWEEIVCVIEVPKLVKKGLFTVAELDSPDVL